MDFRANISTELPYQNALAACPARFIVRCQARQTGKSRTVARIIASELLEHSGRFWLIISTGERAAKEAAKKVAGWLDALGFATRYALQETRDAVSGESASEITLHNGSRCVAIPANPSTARGYSGNIWLDEFAHCPDADEIWKAVFPTLTNPLKATSAGQPGGFRCIVTSTPNGKTGRFAKIWFGDAPGSAGVSPAPPNTLQWDRAIVTIHDAIDQGLPLDAAVLRQALDDDLAWRQEYECEFLENTAEQLLPLDLVKSCEDSAASAFMPPETWDYPALVMGVDFGRVADLTVFWTCRMDMRMDGRMQLTTVEILCLHNMSTPRQWELLKPRLARVRRCAMDYTGPGVGLGDNAMEEFGEYDPDHELHGRVMLCTFTNALKCLIFPRMRLALETRSLLLPPEDISLRDDLTAIHRSLTPTGLVTYSAPRLPGGHSDRGTAAALVLHAASQSIGCGPAAAHAVNIVRGSRL